MQLDGGTWVTVNKALLTVGQQEIKYPTRPNSSTAAANANANPMSMSYDSGKQDRKAREAGSKRLHLQQALLAAAELERIKMDARKEQNAKLAYKLYFKCVQECTFLIIPYSSFVKIMRDCKSMETIKRKCVCL